MDASVREIRVAGREALLLASVLLQRARRVNPDAGVWEAADTQWNWARPRKSDDVDKLFWIDGDGPVAGVLLTCFGDDEWQCDPVTVPGGSGPEARVVWRRAFEHAGDLGVSGFDIPVEDHDDAGRALAERFGCSPGHQDGTAWMAAAERPTVEPPRDGFVIVDRTQRPDVPHSMQARLGDDVEQRLAQCPLYDPSLDLAVETVDGEVAGNSLYWFDPTTKVGLVEPVRVEDAFQRRGLARAMLCEGIDRLVRAGAERIKVSYESEFAAALYHGIGFRPTSTTTWFRAPASL